jgi:UDP-glucose 4-epimerase
MRYLITGGPGFIGSHLVDALTTRGDDVLVLDDLSTGTVENLDERQGKTEDARSHRERRFAPRGSAAGSVDLVEGSVTNEAPVDDCMASVDVCVHLASAVGVQLGINQPLESLLRNVRGSDIVISAAARHGRRLLFASTSEIYGKNCGGRRIVGPHPWLTLRFALELFHRQGVR